MVSEFGLVCGNKYYVDFVLIVWFLAPFYGILCGWLSDKYGRRNITVISLLIETVSSILVTISPDIISNIIFRFFLRINASTIYIAYVWLMESVNSEFREFIASFFWAYGCLAYMIFPWVASAMKNWRYAQLISVIPNILYIFVIFIPESPRWSFVTGDRVEAFKTLKKISKINKLDIHFEEEDIIVAEECQNGDLMAALRSKTYRSHSIVAILLQFSTSLVYLGVSLNISLLSRDIILSAFLLGLMETPALFISFICLRFVKRKISILIFGLIGSTLFWVSVFFGRDMYWQGMIRIALGCLGKIVISSVNQMTIIYVAELFPTSHRSLAFAYIKVTTCLAFISAIYVNKLSSTYFLLPMTIFLVFMWFNGFLAFCLLPETKGLPLPETLEDQNQLLVGSEDNYLIYMINKRSVGGKTSSISERSETEDKDDEKSKLINKSDL